MGERKNDLSQRLKKEAERQRVTVELTEEQLESLKAAWNQGDPTAPAVVTFLVKGKPAAEMAVAGYRYAGSECCV
jgi:hypothetical protein